MLKTLAEILATETPLLRQITESQASHRPKGEGAWSRKEELGHLIDSAVNNHVRFVRATLEPAFTGPPYEQDGWVHLAGYHRMPWSEIVDLWEGHNRLLLRLSDRIPCEKLTTPCFIGAAPQVTLAFLIEDYAAHQQHHLDHILGREKISSYPGATLDV